MTPHLAAVAHSWQQAEQQQYNACHHCSHHTWAQHDLRCACPALVYAGQTRPVALLRQPYGGCGPEAVHMAAPWLAH